MKDTRKNSLKDSYLQTAGLLNGKRLALCCGAVFLLSLIPELMLSFVNRAAGDDYGYAVETRAAWQDTGSLLQVVKAAGRTVEHYYVGWQGTWSSIFLFSLQPEVFHDKAYVAVAFCTLGLWTLSTAFLFREAAVKILGFSGRGFLSALCLFLFVSIQYIPGVKSSIFWYNGAVHYLLPFALAQILLACLMRFFRRGRWRDFTAILIIMLYLGGSNYQAALFGALVTLVFIGAGLAKAGGLAADRNSRGNKKSFLLLLPLVIELTGLAISMKAPGNKARAGADFGFDLVRAAETVAGSFLKAVTDIGLYIREKPLVFVILFLLLLIIWEQQLMRKGNFVYPLPGVFLAGTFCLYAAMQAPELYAGVDVSLGVANTNYQIFLLMLFSNMVYLTGWIVRKRQTSFQEGENGVLWKENKFHGYILVPALAVCLILAFLFKWNMKDSTAWLCIDYMRSGQAADYKEQMDLQTAILTDDSVRNPVIPMINDEQGPLMQMPVTSDKEAWTNEVTRKFYRKDSVAAIPRKEWEAIYLKEE